MRAYANVFDFKCGQCFTCVAHLTGGASGRGENAYGALNVPGANTGTRFRRVGAGQYHTVLQDTNGQVTTYGDSRWRMRAVPEDVRIISFACGHYHTVYLLEGGTVLMTGSDMKYKQVALASEHASKSYRTVAAGALHTVLLCEDGHVVAEGDNEFGQCDIPSEVQETTCIFVAAGRYNSAVILSDGTCRIFGYRSPEIVIPDLELGLEFVQVALGDNHVVFLLSDGTARCSGSNQHGQCEYPRLPEGASYTKVDAGANHTGLLRSDGVLKLFGYNVDDRCSVAEDAVEAKNFVIEDEAAYYMVCEATVLPKDLLCNE